MPALNFKKQFAPLILSGQKRQTIRARRADGRDPRQGQPLMLYVGMRTKGCEKLGDATCESVTPIAICRDGITLGTMPFPETAMAQADGFTGWPEMREWFEEQHGLPFHGFLIQWGSLQPNHTISAAPK